MSQRENYDLHYPGAIIVIIGVLAYFIGSIFFNVFAVCTTQCMDLSEWCGRW